MYRLARWCVLSAILFVLPIPLLAAGKARHVVVVVWDGMRPDFISAERTPTLFQLAARGVLFQQHHAVYCTATEVNGTALATGAYPQTSGIVANREYRPELNRLKSVATEATDTIRRSDAMTGGRYLLRPTVAEMLQAAGKTTAIAGTKAVTILHDRRARLPGDAVGVNLSGGQALPDTALTRSRQALGPFPAAVSKDSLQPNEPRDQWTTRALLGPLWNNAVPVFSVLWLSEPDSSQHAAGPGSPKALAALASCDRQLADVIAELDKRGLNDQTDIFVVSDHGFSTVEGMADVCKALRKAGFEAFREFAAVPKDGCILVVGQGGSVLFYVIGQKPRVVRRLVRFLQEQPFSGPLFTREPMPGTFTLKQALIDSPQSPDVVMSMRWSAEKSRLGTAGLQLSDGTGAPSAGGHASLSRFDLHNTLVAAGPDFKRGFVNLKPTGNIDLAPTILWLLAVNPGHSLDGRVLSEALTIEAPPSGQAVTNRFEAARRVGDRVWRQYLKVSRVDQTVYLDEGNASLSGE